MNDRTTLTARAARRVASLSEMRATRVARRQLVAELDSYRTEAERIELDEIIARHSDEQLRQLAELTGRRYGAA